MSNNTKWGTIKFCQNLTQGSWILMGTTVRCHSWHRTTYRARNGFPKAHAELMTEDVQQEAFTFLQIKEERISCLVPVTSVWINVSVLRTLWSSGFRLGSPWPFLLSSQYSISGVVILRQNVQRKSPLCDKNNTQHIQNQKEVCFVVSRVKSTC